MKHNDKLYRELRCKKCRKFICHEYIFAGRILFVCPRCGEENVFVFKHFGNVDLKDYKLDNASSIKLDSKGGEIN